MKSAIPNDRFLAKLSISNETQRFAADRKAYSIVPVTPPYGNMIYSGARDYVITARRYLEFRDIMVDTKISDLTDAIAESELHTIVDFYLAFFNRVPDALGLAYWIQLRLDGATMEDIAARFHAAGMQYAAQTGYSESMSDRDFITVVYRNVLGREAPDQEGLNYWSARLGSGKASRASLVREILVSAHSYKNDANYGHVANLLDNRYMVSRAFALDHGLSYQDQAKAIEFGIQLSGAVTPSDTTRALQMIEDITGIPKSQCTRAPGWTSFDGFRAYAGDCLLSYTVSSEDMQRLGGINQGSVVAIETEIRNKVKQSFKDEFDTLIFLFDFEQKPPAAPNYGFYVANQKCAQIDCDKFLGSVTLTFWNDAIAGGPLLHELFHQFGNYGLPTQDISHWGYSSVAGQLGGWDPATFENPGAGLYTGYRPRYFGVHAPESDKKRALTGWEFGTNANGGNGVKYAPLELYLMGLIPAAEVPPIQVAKNPQRVAPTTGYIGSFTAAGFDTYSASQVAEAQLKLGYPMPDLQKSRKAYKAMILVLTDKERLSERQARLLTESINQFSRPGPADDSWAGNSIETRFNFWMATGGRATYSMNAVSAYRH